MDKMGNIKHSIIYVSSMQQVNRVTFFSEGSGKRRAAPKLKAPTSKCPVSKVKNILEKLSFLG